MQSLPLIRPPRELESPNQHYEQLHKEAHGTVIVWECAPSGGKGRWYKLDPGDPHIPSLLAMQKGRDDRYVTVNEFYGWRLVRLVKSLRACYVDVDGCDDLQLVLLRLEDTRLPKPSIVVFSGRGLHLYWLHNPVPAQVLPVWQRMQDTLIHALKPFGADDCAKDCTRVLRLVGSINSKNNAVVRGLVLDPVPWVFRDLTNEVLGFREKKQKVKVFDLATVKAHRSERIRTGSIYDRWHLVYQDLLAIARWYDFGGIPYGHRDTWLFLSAVSLSWFANVSTLRDELEKQAKIWTPGLKVSEVRDALKSPLERAKRAAAGEKDKWQFQGNWQEVDPRYRYKRETLWNLMEPLIEPELAPQLRAIVSDETKAAHERDREAKRDRVAEGRYKTRHTDSVEQQKPWESLGISRATYYRRKDQTA